MSYEIPKNYLGDKRENIVSSDAINMLHALVASLQSEDKSTQVGSCFVDSKGKLMSVGYNTALWDPDKFPYEGDLSIGRENTKYPYINHAEIMGVFNYKGHITDFEGATLYVTLKPCENCARFVAGLGVKRIVCLNERDYGGIATNDVIIENCDIEYVRLKDISDITGVSLDFTKDEKNNIKLLQLENNEQKKEDN